MGKRKRTKELRPWCWYCERDFESLSVLIEHQKAKHFKCSQCRRTWYSIRKLIVHAMSQHDMNIISVANALPHRTNQIHLEIIGMDGIPEDDLYAHEKQVLGTPESKKPKDYAYGELSEEQLRSQVAQFQAESAMIPTTIDSSVHYSGDDPYYYVNQSYFPPQSYNFNDNLAYPHYNSTYDGYSSWHNYPSSTDDATSMNHHSKVKTTPSTISSNTSQPITSTSTAEATIKSTLPKHDLRISTLSSPVQPRSRDNLTLKRAATQSILVYQHEDLSPDELRANYMKSNLI
ncbi:uncharacterized protein BX664DRAFT_326926, partial [Halteromyces radiatus]|uniref:uncharacterized protein n=1 Tax=Halteromyces radiatus TaxID=101107 RepID=UPI002220C320